MEAALADLDGGVDTIFWGGGTPGLLLARDLTRLGETLLKRLGRQPEEWTVEIAPGSARPEKLRALRDLGVTRISLGVQSFDPAALEALGRQHSREQVDRAIEWVREAGFPSWNLDLIFGIPGRGRREWEADLHEAISRGPDHISTYCLTFEEDTALYLRLMKGEYRIDRESEAVFHETAHDILTGAGFDHYEVSNFARPGHACRHNLITWRMGWWAGLGPSAASQEDAWRGANPADLGRWLQDAAAGRRGTSDRTILSDTIIACDAAVFGLRMREGIDWRAIRDYLPQGAVIRIEALFRELEHEGRLGRQDGRVALTPAGFLVADAVGAEILEAVSDSDDCDLR